MILKYNGFTNELINPDCLNFDKQFVYLDENSSKSFKTAGLHPDI
jgi:hypothetical protein